LVFAPASRILTNCFLPLNEALCGKESMKVVVQNGSQHPITRKEMEAIIQVIPSSLKKGISSICLYHSENGELDTTFFDKSKTLGFYGHANVSTFDCKIEALEELAFALILLRDTGEIPFKLSKSKISQLSPEVDILVDKWKNIVVQ